MQQYWMLIAGFLDVYDAWEDPENSVRGVGCPENFILDFFFFFFFFFFFSPSLLTALPWFGGLIRTGDFIFE